MADTSEHHYRRQDPRDRTLRAADRDREAVADILRDQHAAGRLDSDEFQERVDRCYGARTYAELDELVADLPGEEPTASAARAWRWPVVALVPLIILAIALIHGHLIWLAIPLFFFVARPMLWRSAGWRRYGTGFAGCGAGCRSPSDTRI